MPWGWLAPGAYGKAPRAATDETRLADPISSGSSLIGPPPTLRLPYWHVVRRSVHNNYHPESLAGFPVVVDAAPLCQRGIERL